MTDDRENLILVLNHHARQLNAAGLAAAANAVAGIAKCRQFRGEEYVGRFYFCVDLPGVARQYLRVEVDDSSPNIPPEKHEVPGTHNKIRFFRKQAGMTQTELAKRAGISRPFLSNVEKGRAAPTIAKAADIAAALGKTVDEVFTKGDGSEQNEK